MSCPVANTTNSKKMFIPTLETRCCLVIVQLLFHTYPGSWRRQAKQGTLDIPVSSSAFPLPLGDPEVSSGHVGHLTRPTGSGCTAGAYPHQMPEPPLAPFEAEVQQSTV